MPMPLEVPDPRGLEGLAVFRSRRVEDGRERYRLHLGYFDSRTDAEDALPVVQKHFPSAWVASAPRSGLGSLDDTNLSEFRLVRSPSFAAEIERQSNAAATPAQDAQRYVVQLSWATRRIDPSEIEQLTIFQAYALYTVTLARAGVRYYGIRLGFFTSAISARQVALYVRSEFPAVAVVPISEREYTRAREMVAQREIRASLQVVPAAALDISPEPLATEVSESDPPEASVPSETSDSGPLVLSETSDSGPVVLSEMTDSGPVVLSETTDSEPVALSESTDSAPAALSEPTGFAPVALSEPTDSVPVGLLETADSVPVAPSETADSGPVAAPAPETAAESTSPVGPPPFTEVYVAEAAARISGRTQSHVSTREELLGALASANSRGENPHRSALVRLLHRLADRIG
jgi:hypothetical protein